MTNSIDFTYGSLQGLYYRKPVLSSQFVFVSIAATVTANVIGSFIWGYNMLISGISLLFLLILVVCKRISDGRMGFRTCPCDTHVTFGDKSLVISNVFKEKVSVEDFVCDICESNSRMREQRYRIKYSQLVHVFWLPESFEFVLLLKGGKFVLPFFVTCPLRYKSDMEKCFSSQASIAVEGSTYRGVFVFIKAYNSRKGRK